jgi:tRNA-splicing ligase RtcB
MKRYGITVRDRELACAPFSSPEGQAYFGAMTAAANSAFANRQLITHRVREVFAKVFGRSAQALGLSVVYDVCHNTAKLERHMVGDAPVDLVVHRKGATRAFGPGAPDVPEAYRDVGQPVLIPGDMGRSSYVLVGTETAMRESFGSTCHGAGRVSSRSAMLKERKGLNPFREMEERWGVLVMAQGYASAAEEMPDAYKDVSEVVDVCESAGLSKKVVRLKPLGVVKG